MKLSTWISTGTSIVLIVSGSLIWTSRLDYSPDPIVERRLSSRLMTVDSSRAVDLSDACRKIETTEGWILFVLNANLVSDTTSRTYFETDVEPLGMFVESEPGLMRVGLGLGPGPESDLQIPIRVVRRDQTETIVIAVTRDETRVVANAVDKSAAWPGYLADEWLCTRVQVGSDTRELSQGFRCERCNARLRYAVGSGIGELNDVLDEVSNVKDFNRKRWIGTTMTLVGFALLLLPKARKIVRLR